MKMRHWQKRCSWFALACLAAVLLIVVCNIWMLCCGHCSPSDYLHIPPVGWWVLAANLLAGAVLIVVRGRKKGHSPGGDACCSCGAPLRDGWRYCPDCGATREN